MNKKLISAAAGALLVGAVATGCSNDADVASHNVSKAADNFEVNRRIVLFNGITDKVLLEIIGACSIKVDSEESQLEVICKTAKDKYKKHFLGLSDNVSYFVEQGEPVSASNLHYRVTFRPQQIIPNVDFQGSSDGSNG